MRALTVVAAALLAGCSGVTVSFGDLEPLPGVDEWLYPEAPIDVELVRYQRDCASPEEETSVTLLPDLAAVKALEAERALTLAPEDRTAEGAYALIELGNRSTAGDGFAVSRAGGRRGATALIKITGLSFSGQPSGEGRSAPCALVALPALPKGRWERVRVLDQVSGMRATSPPLKD